MSKAPDYNGFLGNLEDIVRKFLKAIGSQGGDPIEYFHALSTYTGTILVPEMCRLLVLIQQPEPMVRVYINPRETLKELIARGGRYGYINRSNLACESTGLIDERYPKLRGNPGWASIKLLPIKEKIHPSDVPKLLKVRGLKPISVQHLCAIEAQYPILRMFFRIFAFGSMREDYPGRLTVPLLSNHGESESGPTATLTETCIRSTSTAEVIREWDPGQSNRIAVLVPKQ